MDSNQSREESQREAMASLKRQTIVESSCDLLIKRANKELPLLRHKHQVVLFAKAGCLQPNSTTEAGSAMAGSQARASFLLLSSHTGRFFPSFGSIWVQPVEDRQVQVLCKWYLGVRGVNPSYQSSLGPGLSSSAFVSKLTVVT